MLSSSMGSDGEVYLSGDRGKWEKRREGKGKEKNASENKNIAKKDNK